MKGTVQSFYGYLEEYDIFHKDKYDRGYTTYIDNKTYITQKTISVRSDDPSFEVTRARFAALYPEDLKLGKSSSAFC